MDVKSFIRLGPGAGELLEPEPLNFWSKGAQWSFFRASSNLFEQTFRLFRANFQTFSNKFSNFFEQIFKLFRTFSNFFEQIGPSLFSVTAWAGADVVHLRKSWELFGAKTINLFFTSALNKLNRFTNLAGIPRGACNSSLLVPVILGLT